MSGQEEQKVKIRFKFRSGEEFEAEGSPSFIERQRGEFLKLIGKTRKSDFNEAGQADLRILTHPAKDTAQTDRISVPVQAAPKSPELLPALPNRRVWEEITRIDEQGTLYLKKKSRSLPPDTAALLLTAAAKILLGAENGFSALALAKALAKSGYAGGRLDRILAAELRQGTIKAFGSKRSRAYLLSDEGFARAFVHAGKLAEEWR